MANGHAITERLNIYIDDVFEICHFKLVAVLYLFFFFYNLIYSYVRVKI